MVWAQSASGKLAQAITAGDQAVSFNGSVAGTSTVTFPSGLAAIHIGVNAGGTGQWNGYVERINLWPTTRLPNAALQQLTAP
jgi:hypothetical protein